MLGGGLFVGATYWYLYLTGEAGVKIQFDLGGPASAVEGGAGPLKLEGRDPEELDGLRRQLGINGTFNISNSLENVHFGTVEETADIIYRRNRKERQ